jgi:BsaWI restriction endonuclease type 2
MRGREMPKTKSNEHKTCEEKDAILALLNQVKTRSVSPTKAHEIWDKMYSYKESYIAKINASSWNSFIGNVFENLVYYVLKNYIAGISKNKEFENIALFTESEIKNNDYLHQKLSIRYGDKERILPDTDMAIVDFYPFEQHRSQIVAIISCKTSLRERIAQACYWKLKLISSDATRHVRVFLATSDNDEDFVLRQNGQRSRDRIIAEWELDGIYIIRGDFKHEWESDKVKHYERVFDDMVKIFRNIRKNR